MNFLSTAPSLVLIAVPWLLLGLALAGPFLILLTFVVVTAALAALVGGVLALAAAPVLLLRRRRAPARAARLEAVAA